MKKKLLIPAITLTILAGTVYGATQASANMGWQDDSPIVQKLVERFGLNESEVKEVFSELHDERQMERQLEFEANIQASLEKGEITEEQKQAILEKHADMMAEQQNKNREDFQNLTREERQALHEEKRAEMDSWAEENGIDLKYFFGGPRGGRMGGHMEGFGEGR